MIEDVDQTLSRLLRSAAQEKEDATVSPPFGFETRVVALWRSNPANGNNGLVHLLRRVAVIATTVIVVASAAAFYEVRQSRSRLNEPLTNEFAMADSAIQDEVSR
jgi:anti-sigma-K factor RskA